MKRPDWNRSQRPQPELTIEQIADLATAARRNAKRLATAARLLFDNQDYTSAVGLTVLALEEHGKAGVVTQMAIFKRGPNRDQLWKDFYNHKSKTWALLLGHQVPNLKSAEDVEAAWRHAQEHAEHTDQNFKQAAFYVGVDGEGGTLEPKTLFPKERVEGLLTGVELLTKPGDQPIPKGLYSLIEKHLAGTLDQPSFAQIQSRVLSGITGLSAEAQEVFPEHREEIGRLLHGLSELAGLVSLPRSLPLGKSEDISQPEAPGTATATSSGEGSLIQTSNWRPRVDRVDDPLVEDHWAYQRDGIEVVAKVMVGRPQPIPDDPKKTWYCPVYIEHHEPEVRCLFGVGPVDTLMNAMQYVRNFFNDVRPRVRAHER